MKVRSSKASFGILCLSIAVGLLSYWLMFINVLPKLLRPEASSTLPLLSGVVGTASSALFYFALSNLIPFFRGKPEQDVVLVRKKDGSLSVRRSLQEGVAPQAGLEGESPERKYGGIRRGLKVGVLLVIVLEVYLFSVFISGTFTPLLVISSQSMAPTLNRGDLIVVKGVDVETVGEGVIIAFHVPSPYDRSYPSPTVHRVVGKKVEKGGIYFQTKGDNNPNQDPWMVPADNVVGVCVHKIPYIGLPILFLKNPYGLMLIATGIALWIIYPYIKKQGRKLDGE